MFVDMSNKEEREAVWKISVAKYGRDPAKFNLGALAGGTEGFTGSEIEQAFIEALYSAFADGKEPSTQSVSMALDELVPLSKLMAEQVGELRKWAKGRARMATSQTSEKTSRRIAA